MVFLRRILFSLIFVVTVMISIEKYLSGTKWNRWSRIKILQSKIAERVAPSLSPLLYLKFLTNSLNATEKVEDDLSKLLPLAGLPNSTTVICNEEEELIYKSDRHGFNNPDEIWNLGAIDFAFIGDSYVQGYCLPNTEHFLGKLRAQGWSILNLGLYGVGPLTELGILREYASIKKPKVVIWTFMANDLTEDLPIEISIPILLNYLDGEKQNLVKYPQELETLQKRTLERIAKSVQTSPNPSDGLLNFEEIRKWLLNIWLKKTRSPFLVSNFRADYVKPDGINWTLYSRVLVQAKSEIEAWGGKLVFLYLPDAGQWNPTFLKSVQTFRRLLKTNVDDAHITFLDFYESLEKEPNPLVLYNVFDGQYGHFNRLGQEKLFQFLKTRLK